MKELQLTSRNPPRRLMMVNLTATDIGTIYSLARRMKCTPNDVITSAIQCLLVDWRMDDLAREVRAANRGRNEKAI